MQTIDNAISKIKSQNKRPSLRGVVYLGLIESGVSRWEADKLVSGLSYRMPAGSNLRDFSEQTLRFCLNYKQRMERK